MYNNYIYIYIYYIICSTVLYHNILYSDRTRRTPRGNTDRLRDYIAGTYTYTYIYIYIYTQVCIYIYIYIYICMCVYIYIYIYIHIYTTCYTIIYIYIYISLSLSLYIYIIVFIGTHNRVAVFDFPTYYCLKDLVLLLLLL